MNDTLNNELAQVCNNLYRTIQRVKKYRQTSNSIKLAMVHDELEAEYCTLFKLIYNDEQYSKNSYVWSLNKKSWSN